MSSFFSHSSTATTVFGLPASGWGEKSSLSRQGRTVLHHKQASNKQDVKCKLLQIVQKNIVHIYPEGYFQVTLIAKIETINNGTLIFIWSEMWKITSFLRLDNYFSLSRSRNAQAIINRFQAQKHEVLIRSWSDKAFN